MEILSDATFKGTLTVSTNQTTKLSIGDPQWPNGYINFSVGTCLLKITDSGSGDFAGIVVEEVNACSSVNSGCVNTNSIKLHGERIDGWSCLKMYLNLPSYSVTSEPRLMNPAVPANCTKFYLREDGYTNNNDTGGFCVYYNKFGGMNFFRGEEDPDNKGSLIYKKIDMDYTVKKRDDHSSIVIIEKASGFEIPYNDGSLNGIYFNYYYTPVES